MIDIVGAAFATLQIDDVLGRGHDVFIADDTRIEIDVDAELLVDLVTTDAADVVTLRIEEETLEQGLRVGDGWWVSGAEAAINILQRLFGIVSRILLETLDDRVVVLDVDDLDRLDLEIHDLTDNRLGQRLEGTGDHDIGVGAIADFRDENLGADGFVIEIGLQLEVADGVEKLDDFLVGRVAERTEEGGDEELAAALAPIEMDVEQIARVVHHFKP